MNNLQHPHGRHGHHGHGHSIHGDHNGHVGPGDHGGHGGHGGRSGHGGHGGHGSLGHGYFCGAAIAILARFAFQSAINTSFQRKLHNFFLEPKE